MLTFPAVVPKEPVQQNYQPSAAELDQEEQAETEEAEHRDDNAVLVDAWLDSNG